MSEIINLNDDNYDVSSTIIFNAGNAGKVDHVSMRAEKKTSTDNSPDWKVFYKDSFGGEINEGYYYLDSKHENFKKQLKYQGAALKHIIHAAFGAETLLPNFATAKEMLDQCMLKINSVDERVLFRIGVSYGTTNRPSPYLRVKNYPEFIEPMTVTAEDSRIAFSDAYLMVRPVADEEKTSSDTGFNVVSSVVVDNEPQTDMGSFDTASKGPEDLPF